MSEGTTANHDRQRNPHVHQPQYNFDLHGGESGKAISVGASLWSLWACPGLLRSLVEQTQFAPAVVPLKPRLRCEAFSARIVPSAMYNRSVLRIAQTRLDLLRPVDKTEIEKRYTKCIYRVVYRYHGMYTFADTGGARCAFLVIREQFVQHYDRYRVCL